MDIREIIKAYPRPAGDGKPMSMARVWSFLTGWNDQRIDDDDQQLDNWEKNWLECLKKSPPTSLR